VCSASALDVTLSAFAAERRAATPLCSASYVSSRAAALGARRSRSISPARTALSSKPAAAGVK